MSMALFAPVDDRSWGHMHGWDGGWMWIFGLLMMTLLVVVVVWIARAALTGGTQNAVRPTASDPNHRALEILGERYARGELSTDEYRERADTLR